jgi:hypothetical protein
VEQSKEEQSGAPDWGQEGKTDAPITALLAQTSLAPLGCDLSTTPQAWETAIFPKSLTAASFKKKVSFKCVSVCVIELK